MRAGGAGWRRGGRGAGLWIGLALAAGGCGDRVLRAAGEACTASSECGAGLLCDFGQSPPTCSGMSTVADASPPGTPDAPRPPDAPPGTPDAAVVIDAAVPDAATPDAATPDAATPDAAP